MKSQDFVFVHIPMIFCFIRKEENIAQTKLTVKENKINFEQRVFLKYKLEQESKV
jgi:hypothetical protein